MDILKKIFPLIILIILFLLIQEIYSDSLESQLINRISIDNPIKLPKDI
jgi:hypothetical protein